ncbi:hypothetical protein bcere0028_56250 [Bacillus cereus AH1271]|nr:hypothetical protein bcere0028_56250 [Bacillus cereus AH1271]
MARRTGSKSCILYREGSGFGWEKQRIWVYGTFKYKELKQMKQEGWIEDKKVRGSQKQLA